MGLRQQSKGSRHDRGAARTPKPQDRNTKEHDGQDRLQVRGRVHRLAARGSAGRTRAGTRRHPQGCAQRRGSDFVQDPQLQTTGWPRALFRWVEEAPLALPATRRVIAAFKDDLASYEVNKGTIRFPLFQPVPVKLIERIAKFRAKEVAEREKAAAPKK